MQALLTTFQQPLASSDTPRHSLHGKQRRFGGLKQASSLDCLDERIPQDDLVTQSLNINNPAAFNDGDLLTRSLDSFQGRRSLSSVSINVDSGEKVRKEKMYIKPKFSQFVIYTTRKNVNASIQKKVFPSDPDTYYFFFIF